MVGAASPTPRCRAQRRPAVAQQSAPSARWRSQLSKLEVNEEDGKKRRISFFIFYSYLFY